MSDTAFDFEVRRDDLRTTRFVDAHGQARPGEPLADGDALLRTDRFGLTANNITYGLMGDAMQYWNFFPASEGWGRIPVWGFAAVVQSRAAGVREGERVYGYLPISSYLRVTPARVDDEAFLDGSAHRRPLPPVYQRYVRAAPQERVREDLRILLSPLFGTGFLLDDWVFDQGVFGARQIVFASASSRTALATAFQLMQRPQRAYQIIGLTSGSNRAFCESTGYYDQVASYDHIESLPASTETLFIDMAGDPRVVTAVHAHFGSALRHSCIVGLTHRPDGIAPPPGLVGPAPEFFFAPGQGDKRRKEWGMPQFTERLSTAQERFYDSARRWLEFEHSAGRAAIESAYHRVLDGKAKPSDGLILSP